MSETNTTSVEGDRLEQIARIIDPLFGRKPSRGWRTDDEGWAETLRNHEVAMSKARQIAALPCKGGEDDQAFRRWVIIQEPGRVPDRKGAFLTRDQVKDFLVEAIDARPTATLTIVSQDCYGDPIFSDAGEWLLMTDARYRAVYQRYIDRLKAAAPSTEPDTGRGLREALEKADRLLTRLFDRLMSEGTAHSELTLARSLVKAAKADAEVDRIMAMTDDELLAEARANGEDPEHIAAEMRSTLDQALAALSDTHETPEMGASRDHAPGADAACDPDGSALIPGEGETR